MKIPELLCPAGSMAALDAALHFGADAVYAGLQRFSLRSFAGNFDFDQLEMAVKKTHQAGKKFYVAMNSFLFGEELDAYVETAAQARKIGVDAAIVSDLGAISLIRSRVPDLPIHVSTQANTTNEAAAKVYADMGCERVVLAREMSLEQIGKLTSAMKGRLQIETFVHGASCMSFSGRCLLSAYLTGRSGNRGACAQPCRWKYALMEEKRPGEYFPIDEDEKGTYLLSARDLCLMPILPRLCAAGTDSLKVEGRMKTEYYVAVVTGAYRRGLDLLAEGEEAFEAQLPELLQELKAASHRDSDTGFLLGTPPEVPGEAEGFHQEREYVALVMEGPDAEGVARLQLKNRFFAGDELELMTPGKILKVQASPFLREKTGEVLESCGIGGEIIRMKLPACTAGDMLRGPVRNHRQ